MITKEEAMVELRAIMEPALKEIGAISRKVDQEFDKFAEAVGFNGAHNGLKEALWLIEFEMEHVKAEESLGMAGSGRQIATHLGRGTEKNQ